MTDEQINIAIAEACGWEDVSETCWSGLNLGIPPASENLTTTRNWEYVNGVGYYEIKDYCNDLNAMHEAESRFKTATEQMLYAAKILWVRGQGDLFEAGDLNVDHCWIAARATARERAEAFLRTIGKWEDQP